MKLSLLLIKIIIVPLTGLLIGKCITPQRDNVAVGEPLPIDGVWKTILPYAQVDHDFYFRIAGGRMYLTDVEGPDSLKFSEDIGKVFFCDIASQKPNKYTGRIFTMYGRPAIDGCLEVVGDKLLVTPLSPLLFQQFTRVSETNEDLCRSFPAR